MKQMKKFEIADFKFINLNIKSNVEFEDYDDELVLKPEFLAFTFDMLDDSEDHSIVIPMNVGYAVQPKQFEKSPYMVECEVLFSIRMPKPSMKLTAEEKDIYELMAFSSAIESAYVYIQCAIHQHTAVFYNDAIQLPMIDVEEEIRKTLERNERELNVKKQRPS